MVRVRGSPRPHGEGRKRSGVTARPPPIELAYAQPAKKEGASSMKQQQEEREPGNLKVSKSETRSQQLAGSWGIGV